MFNEALTAVQAGDRTRARDLLTRLLKTTQDNPEYWVWMSAVVETAKERTYCLNQALKLDPQHRDARRGLIMTGQMAVDESLILPPRLQKRGWQGKNAPTEEEPKPGIPPVTRMSLIGGGLVLVIGLMLFFLLSTLFKPVEQGPIVSSARRYPTETPAPTQTVVQLAAGVTQSPPAKTMEPTPLWMLLKVTFTPTPLYVNTPHPASVSESFKFGLRGYLRGDWANVENFMKQVLTVEPSAVDARYYIADAYRLQGKTNEAMKAFNDIIKTNPDFAPAYLGRARTRLILDPGAVSLAQADLETALLKDTNYGEVYLELCTLLIEQKDYAAAEPVLNQAARVLPDSPVILVYRAQISMLAGAYEQALTDAERALQLDPTLLPAYLMKGEALVRTGDLDGALEALTIYTTYVKDDSQAWLWIGLAQEEAGKSQAAVEAYSQALRLNKRLLDAYLSRARLYMEMDEAEGALDDYRAALGLDDKSFEASIGVGKALLLLGYAGDAYMQFERIQVLAKEDAQMAELIYWRAQSLEKLDELAAALRDWYKLLELPEDSVTVEMLTYAKARIAALVTATPTPLPATSTRTLTPSRTPQPSATPKASATPKVSATPKPTSTR